MASSTALDFDPRLVAGAGLAAVLIATTFAAVVGNPVVVLVATYVVAFGVAVTLFGEDMLSRAVNTVIVAYGAAIAFVCTLSPLPDAAVQGLPLTDRLNYYYVYYIGTSLAGVEENIEPGFLLLVNTARPILPFEYFLALSAAGVLLSLVHLSKAARQGRIVGVLVLSLLAYFTFWSGALNITRQFIAAGVAIWGVAFLIKQGKASTRVRALAFTAAVAAAYSIHSTAIIFGLFGVAYVLRQYAGLILAGAWTTNVTVFGLNTLNMSPLSLIPGLSERLSRYDASQISDASLAQFQSAGVTTGNRLDWAMALLVPIIAYALPLIGRDRKSSPISSDNNVILALLYTVLCMPFYLFSFLTFGDRLAFYAFLILPTFLLGVVTTYFGKEVRYAALLSIGAVCSLQVAIGLYGYTPKLWLTGAI